MRLGYYTLTLQIDLQGKRMSVCACAHYIHDMYNAYENICKLKKIWIQVITLQSAILIWFLLLVLKVID